MSAGVIALIVLGGVLVHRRRVGRPDRAAGAGRRRRAARPLRADARPGAGADRPVRRPRQAAARPPRAGRRLPAAAGDHRGQPRGRHRHRHLLHGHRPEGRHLRDRQPAAGDRAADRHHAAQRDRRAHARGDADQPRQHQLAAARRARRGDRPLGHPRQPRRAQVGRAAADGAGGDGEADARRARPPRDDPHRRGRQAVADPHRRGREAGGGAQGRGCPHVGDPARRGRVEGDRDRLPGHPRRRARPAAPELPVPADAAAARPGLGQQDLRDPERVQPGARQHRQRARQVRRWPRRPAAAEAQAAPERPSATRSTRRPRPTPPRRRPPPSGRPRRPRAPRATRRRTSAQLPGELPRRRTARSRRRRRPPPPRPPEPAA